jgi:hypothetical protein
MIIQYFAIDEDDNIGKYEIDTKQREYVSHNDDTVTTETYNFSEERGRRWVWQRNLGVVKQQLIERLKNGIKWVEGLTESDVKDYTSSGYEY